MKPRKMLTCACGEAYALNRTGRPAVRCPECTKKLKRARDRARYSGEPFPVPRVYVEPPTRPEELGSAEPLLVTREERERYVVRRILQRFEEGVPPEDIAKPFGFDARKVHHVLRAHGLTSTGERGPPLGLPTWGQ